MVLLTSFQLVVSDLNVCHTLVILNSPEHIVTCDLVYNMVVKIKGGWNLHAWLRLQGCMAVKPEMGTYHLTCWHFGTTILQVDNVCRCWGFLTF